MYHCPHLHLVKVSSAGFHLGISSWGGGGGGSSRITWAYSGTGLESIVPPLACLNESVNQILGVHLLMCALKLG